MTTWTEGGPLLLRAFAPAEVEALRRAYSDATPFPHVVIDEVLDAAAAPELAREFPRPDWTGWTRYEGNDYQRHKRICSDTERMPPLLASLVHECAAPRFLALLEEITGIPGLIPDPYLNGGGLHCSPEGGVLLPHSDFHHYERLGLYRRLNVLIYLNEEWSDADGGALELFADRRATVVARRIPPVLGRGVVFRTDFGSVHGFTQPVADGKARNSLALYFYTAGETPGYSGDTTTYWRHDAPARGVARARLRAYRALLFVARGIAWCAHRVNPSRMQAPRP